MRARQLVRAEGRELMRLGALSDAGGGPAREGLEVVGIRDVRVREVLPVADLDPHSGALIDAGDGFLDLVVVEREGDRVVAFPEQLSPLAAARQRRAESALRVARGDDGSLRRCDRCADGRLPTDTDRERGSLRGAVSADRYGRNTRAWPVELGEVDALPPAEHQLSIAHGDGHITPDEHRLDVRR